jgi:hypothetical protein
MTMMVNSKPMMAVGLNLGMNLVSYHSSPRCRIRLKRVRIPAAL